MASEEKSSEKSWAIDVIRSLFPPWLLPDNVLIQRQEQVITQEMSKKPTIVNDKIIWGVISDFNFEQAVEMQKTVMGAFVRLGYNHMAERIIKILEQELNLGKDYDGKKHAEPFDFELKQNLKENKCQNNLAEMSDLKKT